jgi:hypothetical protein
MQSLKHFVENIKIIKHCKYWYNDVAVTIKKISSFMHEKFIE